MGKRKIIMYIIIIFIILLVLGIGYLVYININREGEGEREKEYTPEIEISDDKLRETVVNLYFINKDTNELDIEARQIDSKYLLENPYLTLIKLLIDGPQKENLEKLIPENTIINKVEFMNGIVYIDLSNNFEEQGNKEMILNSIEKTLKQLNEVDEINFTSTE